MGKLPAFGAIVLYLANGRWLAWLVAAVCIGILVYLAVSGRRES